MSNPNSAPPADNPMTDAWHEQILPAAKNPFLLNLLLKHWQRVLARVTYFYNQLASLPRRNRRALQRALATSLVGAAMLLALSSAPAVHAGAPIVVDGATCTLDNAINSANTDSAVGGCTTGYAGVDTLDLQTNIILTAALPNVTTPIILDGNSHYLSGNNAYRAFYIVATGINTGDLTINDTTIKNAKHASGSGGAIVNAYGAVTLNNSTITGSYAGDDGGAIYSYKGNVTLNNSAITENTANLNGGGVYLYYGSLNLYKTTVSGNTATRGVGGGIRNRSGSATIDQSTISGNYAPQGQGGGIFSYSTGGMDITSSTIDNNTAYNDGGGIFNISIMSIADSSVSGNTLTGTSGYRNGGGIYNDYDLTMRRTIVTNNTARNGGGVANGYSAKIYDSTISYSKNGGGVYSYGTDTTLVRTVIDHNYHSRNSGGIYCGNGTLHLTDSIVSNNTGNDDAGGIDHDFCDSYIYGSTISGNVSNSGESGGMDVDYSTVKMSNSTVSDNHSHNNYGYGYGGIGVHYGTLYLYNSTITGNSTDGRGGGIYAYHNANIKLSRNIIAGNSAAVSGNEIYADIPTGPIAPRAQRKNQAAAERAAKAQKRQAHIQAKSDERSAAQAEKRKARAQTNKPQRSAKPPAHPQRTAPKIKKPLAPNVTAIQLNDYNLIGDNSQTNAQALYNVTPGGNDILATGNGATPTALGSILSALGNNGGKQAGDPNTALFTVQTNALVSGSPALDKVPNAECAAAPVNAVDQRGITRPQNILCDIGAFEFQATTAVNVTGLRGKVNKTGNIVLKWKSTNETALAGFNIYRKMGKQWVQVSKTMLQAKHPGTPPGDKYRFTDKNIQAGKTYRYKIRVQYLDGHTEWTKNVRVQKP